MTKTGKAYLFNHEGGTAIYLRNSFSIVTVLLQYSCQHSCQEIAALLSRDYSTPVSKMLKILEFLSPMHFIRITLLPMHLNERLSRSLKNGRR